MASAEHDNLVAMIQARRSGGSGVFVGGDAQAAVAGVRRFMDLGKQSWTNPDDVTWKAVDAGGAAAEWIVADGADADRVILYLHGGVYLGGSPLTHRDLCARLSRASGARALAVDYRLCPEHPLAAGLEDAVTAYRWLLAQGIDPGRIVVAGDSAGGGLTFRTLVALREAGDPRTAGAVTISAWTDLTASGESYKTNRATDWLFGGNGAGNAPAPEWTLGSLLGETELDAPEKSPLFAELHDLPPLLVMVSSAEMVLDDSVSIAERARAAGVDVTLDVWDDMIHIWPWFAHFLPEGRTAIEQIGAFVQEQTAAPRPA